MKGLLRRLVREDEGQDLIEYALLAGFVALAVVTGMTALATALNETYENIGTKVGEVPGGGGGG
jgi:pilus assembly protein Flp/PilA